MFAALVSAVLIGAMPPASLQVPGRGSVVPKASTAVLGQRGARVSGRAVPSVLDYTGPDDDGGLGTVSYATATVGGAVTFGGRGALGGGLGIPGSLTQVQVRQSLRLPQTVEIFIPAQQTGTGFAESALLYLPTVDPAVARPLLLAFHSFGHTEYDVIDNSRFARQAQARGWYLLMPLGASTKNYGSMESQRNVELLLDIVLQLVKIDSDRIYGVGFSMGGGGIASYAARHVDPGATMLAAVVNHTGGMSLRHTYVSEPDDDDSIINDPPLEAPDVLDFWNGGPPAQNGFSYSRSSVFDLESGSLMVDPLTDLARNLTHVPFYNFTVSNDQLVYPRVQTQEFHNWLASIGGDSTLVLGPGSLHDWLTIDAQAACEFLASHSLTLPTAGARTIADHDGRYFHFEIDQDAPGALTPFTWSVDSFFNSIAISETANLASIEFDPIAVGLDVFTPMSLDLSTADGSGDEIRITPISNPSSVLRDGFPDLSWTYDPQTQTLILLEFDGFMHSWEIFP